MRHSGKFWSTVTMETSDLQEEERALPALAMAHYHQEDPASLGEEEEVLDPALQAGVR